MTEAGAGEGARARLRALVDSLDAEPSAPSPCPYLPGRESRLLLLRPERLTSGLYQLFLDLNFRRLGQGVYRPQCEGCRECRQLRIDVAGFRPTRAQRRCRKRNADVVAALGWPEATLEKYEVYRRYLKARHDGMMSGSREEFEAFLQDRAPFTREVVYRAGGRLIGAGTLDALPGALSAVYFYFDPAEAHRSPGTFNVLWLVEQCARRGIPRLYLGYHVARSPTMAYKAGFRPHQILGDGGDWR